MQPLNEKDLTYTTHQPKYSSSPSYLLALSEKMSCSIMMFRIATSMEWLASQVTRKSNAIIFILMLMLIDTCSSISLVGKHNESTMKAAVSASRFVNFDLSFMVTLGRIPSTSCHFLQIQLAPANTSQGNTFPTLLQLPLLSRVALLAAFNM